MADTSPRMVGRRGLPLMIGVPLFVFALDFVVLLATYLLLASIAPDVLGEVADSPARFAAWITLVKLPMTLAHLVAVSWRRWMAVPDLPERRGRRATLVKAAGWGVDVACSVLAALIVFNHVADPGDAHVRQLVAVTVVGPFVLPRSVSGLVRLVRWWWRRRHRSAFHRTYD